MKKLKLTYNPKWCAILIIAICLSGVAIGKYVQAFRISEYRWVYQYGSYLNLIMVFSSVVWSFFHPVIIWVYGKVKSKKELIWALIGFLPFFYFIIIMLVF